MTTIREALLEKIARAIQQVRERNGGPPYDGFDAIYGKKVASRMRAELLEEAEAVWKVVQDTIR